MVVEVACRNRAYEPLHNGEFRMVELSKNFGDTSAKMRGVGEYCLESADDPQQMIPHQMGRLLQW